MTRRLAMGELEAAVMDVLWDGGGWHSPGEVHRQLDSGARRRLAYTTVMTVLVRLWKKGRLDRRRDGRAYVYRPVHTRDEHAALRMQELLVEAGDRPAALANFVGSLPAADREQLREVLAGLADRSDGEDRPGGGEG